MKKFQVLTDSTANISKQYREMVDLDYCKMHVSVDGVEYSADLEWAEISPQDFYGAMRNNAKTATTLVTVEEFENKFTKYLDQGLDVLYIACSSKLSGSLNNAKIVASELQERYPDRKIICFDSLRSNYAEGMIAASAAKQANEGKDIEDVVDYLNENRLKFQLHATVESLSWLRKAGRVKASTAFFGNLIGIKPILCADARGNNYAYKKVKGRKNSLDDLVNTTIERIENPSEAVVFIDHADSIEDANYVKEQLESKIQLKEIYINYLGPIIGSTVGPGAIIVNFFGKKVTIMGEE